MIDLNFFCNAQPRYKGYNQNPDLTRLYNPLQGVSLVRSDSLHEVPANSARSFHRLDPSAFRQAMLVSLSDNRVDGGHSPVSGTIERLG